MFVRYRPLLVVALVACAGICLLATPGRADLEQFIRKPEPAFGWKQNGKSSHGLTGDRVYDLHFVSQTWQGNNWQHQLQVYQPQAVAPTAMMLLWVTGGSVSRTRK